MAAATSPVYKAMRTEEPQSAAEFARLVEYYKTTHRAIVRFMSLMRDVPSNQYLVINNHRIRRSDVSKYSNAYVAQLNDLKKIFAKRKRKGKRSNTQLNQLFYISDQLAELYEGADLGPVDPENPRSRKLSSETKLITKYHMSTSSILTSLISHYISANKLKTTGPSGQSKRFKPDAKMKKCYSNTKFMLFGEDLSDREINVTTPPEKVQKITASIEAGHLSAFERLKGLTDKRSGELMYDSKSGLLYTTMMKITNYYRIPKELLTDEEKEALSDPERVEEARELREILSDAKGKK